jgi:hypothetical protein
MRQSADTKKGENGAAAVSFAARSAEHSLLLLLSHRCISPQGVLTIRRLMDAPLDWEYIIATSRAHEVYPLVYDNLKKFGLDRVPAHAQEGLIRLHKINAFRNQHMVEELKLVLGALAHAGIPAIPLKGLVLANSLYGDINLRSSVDIDILVPPQFAHRGMRELCAIGYTPWFPRFERESVNKYIESQLTRRTPIGDCVADLHWAVLWDSRRDKRALDNLWQESFTDDIFGVKGVRMSPEWEFLVLVVHAARSHWRGIKWLSDIHDMCSLSSMDWQRILEKAETFGWTNLVHATLSASNSLFGTPAPPGITFKGSLPPWMKLFPEKPTEVSRHLLPLHWLDSHSAKLSYLARVFLVHTPAEWDLMYLPRYARFLYTPLRLARLAGKWTPRIIRLATSKQELRS